MAQIAESLKQVKKLGELLPALLEMAAPLEAYESLEKIEARIADRSRELDRLDAAIAAAKTLSESSAAEAERARKEAAKLSADISLKAFKDSEPRRREIEAEMAALEASIKQGLATVAGLKDAVLAEQDELEKVKSTIAAVKAEALKALA